MKNEQVLEYEKVNEIIRKRNRYEVGSDAWEAMDYMKSCMLIEILPELPTNNVFVVEKAKLKRFISEFSSDWSIERLEADTERFRYERIIAHPKYVRLALIVKQDDESIRIMKPVDLCAEAVSTDHLMKLLIKNVDAANLHYNFERLHYENNILYIIYKAS